MKRGSEMYQYLYTLHSATTEEQYYFFHEGCETMKSTYSHLMEAASGTARPTMRRLMSGNALIFLLYILFTLRPGLMGASRLPGCHFSTAGAENSGGSPPPPPPPTPPMCPPPHLLYLPSTPAMTPHTPISSQIRRANFLSIDVVCIVYIYKLCMGIGYLYYREVGKRAISDVKSTPCLQSPYTSN
jgi:hypothetical protein